MKRTKSFILLIVLIPFISIYAKEFNVKGIVKDNKNRPLPGVTIVIQNTTKGTVTNMDGKFSLKVKKGDILNISFVGMESQKFEVTDSSFINIVLKEDAPEISEVNIISSYGTKKNIQIRGLNSLSHRKQSQISKEKYNRPNNHESYANIDENGFKSSTNNPLSTFSIDVDRASYSNIRRFINNGQKVPKDAVRIEEMINYFSYKYPQPEGKDKFSINTEYSVCPWNENHNLLHIGLKGNEIPEDELPASNLVFLIDVSGSMSSQNKLPLLKKSFKMLADKLRDNDKVAIVVYAGAAGIVLPSTKGSEKSLIKNSLTKLKAGGSTAGGEGIKLAYKIAQENYIEGGNNRVIIATDGDFNVGSSNDYDMERLIKEKKKSGIFLTCLGFGMGNYKDSKMEILANKGNGNYSYIDNIQEARKTLINEFGGTMFTIAKDVKIQIEFNPQLVQAYRLIGYENRLLNNEDFEDDKKDAGELGSGHTVSAIYEIIPLGVKNKFTKEISLKYQKNKPVKAVKNELATIKLRYKNPESQKSELATKVIDSKSKRINQSSENLRFASSVAMFGMLLRDSDFKQGCSYNKVINLASSSNSYDPEGYKAEFIRIVKSSE